MSTTTTLRPARRLATVLAVAGIAAFGSVALAPAALAADDKPVKVEQDGPASVVEGNGNGPDYFIILDGKGKKIPIFFCDEDKPNKQHNNCIPNPVDGPRF